MKIIADSRESPKRLEKLNKLCDNQLIDFEVSDIDVGDYLLVNDNGEIVAAVEWKSYSDFVSSMINSHLESQLRDMDGYNKPYLFVTGTWLQWKRNARINVPKRSIDGFRTKILYTYKTKMINYDTELEGLVALISLLLRSVNDTPQYQLPERHTKTEDPNFDVMMSIDGLGPKTIKKLRDGDVTVSYLIYACTQPDVKETFKRVYGVSLSNKTINYCNRLFR